jgi:hypothetical protein
MKTVTEKAVAKNAYGKQLETAIPFEFSYEAFETYPELVSAKEEFTNDEQVSERNIQRKQKALASARQSALDAAGIVKPTLENDVLLQLQTVYKVYIAKGKSETEAKALASAAIGEEWPE